MYINWVIMVKLIKAAFVDLPSLRSTPNFKIDFYSLFARLRVESDVVLVFTEIPAEDSSFWGVLRVAANAGALPILCPSDPDPIIVEFIRRFLDLEDLEEICLLSGDNGFFLVLESAKKRGIRIKVILPQGNTSKLLSLIADETVKIEEFALPLVNFSSEAVASEVIKQ